MHPRIRCEELDFEGRNKVLWWDPMAQEQDEPMRQEEQPQVVSPLLTAVRQELHRRGILSLPLAD